MGEKETLQEIARIVTARLIEISKGGQETLASDPVGDSIKALDWKSTDYGDWTFRFKAKGSKEQTPEQKALSDAIEAAGGKLVVGKLEYTLPEGKPFISRKESKK